MVLSGCWAVRLAPEFWACARIIQERGSFAPTQSRIMRAQSRRAARNFAISSKKSFWMFQKKETRGATKSAERPRFTASVT